MAKRKSKEIIENDIQENGEVENVEQSERPDMGLETQTGTEEVSSDVVTEPEAKSEGTEDSTQEEVQEVTPEVTVEADEDEDGISTISEDIDTIDIMDENIPVNDIDIKDLPGFELGSRRNPNDPAEVRTARLELSRLRKLQKLKDSGRA